MKKPKVYFESAPEGHDPDDWGWYVLTQEPGHTIRQGFDSWADAFKYAYLSAAVGYAL